MERGDFVFYDRFLELCRRKGVVPTRAAVEAGISKSLVSKWKANEAKEPSPEVVRKLSEYFGVSPYEVLEDLPAGRGRSTLTERERRDVAREVEQHHGGLGEQRGPDVRRGALFPRRPGTLSPRP